MFAKDTNDKGEEFNKCLNNSVSFNIPQRNCLMATHMIVSKYWLPDLVFGNGPTQSISTLPNGSSTAGMGFKGALGGCWLGLPTIWQVWHALQKLATSLCNPGQ